MLHHILELMVRMGRLLSGRTAWSYVVYYPGLSCTRPAFMDYPGGQSGMHNPGENGFCP